MKGVSDVLGDDEQNETLVKDPVCGMTVNPATSKHRFDYRGETFHFCSAGCRTKFAADPAKYLDKQEPAPPQQSPASGGVAQKLAQDFFVGQGVEQLLVLQRGSEELLPLLLCERVRCEAP